MTDIFISYSHKDEAWKDELQKHLRVLQLSSDFAVWDDRQIELGDNWLPAIERAIANARVAILLVSSDFLSSSFVVQEEIPKFLQRREQDGLKVVPVIVRPCTWQVVPWLADLQGATKDNRALSRFSLGSHQLEEELSQVVLKVHGLLVESRAEEQRKLEVSEHVHPALPQKEADQDARKQAEAEENPFAALLPPVGNVGSQSEGKTHKKMLLSVGGASIILAAAIAYSYSTQIGEVMPVTTGRVPATADYQIHDDGTVTDIITGLMWKQCAEGQQSKDCSGTATTYKWDDAMAKFGSKVSFAVYSDWRMPTLEELRTLVWCSNGISQEEAWDSLCDGNKDNARTYQRPTINLQVFPNTLYHWFWSSTASPDNTSQAGLVNFSGGGDLWGAKGSKQPIRLVRNRQ